MKKIVSVLLAWGCTAQAIDIPLIPLAEQTPSDIPNLFAELLVSTEEAQMIYQIIDTVGTTNILFLAAKFFDLKDLGNQVQHVHPLKFLEIVITDPHLRECMIKIEDSSLKWKGFLDGSGKTPGFKAKCEREFEGDNFEPYILSFCQAVNADPEQVRELIEARDWEKFVRLMVYLER